MKVLIKKELVTDVRYEGSWGAGPIMKSVASTMEVLANDHGVPTMIEWDIPALEETEHIGLEIDGKSVVGYDGVMCIPEEACDLLEELGYNCDEVR